MIDWSLTAMKGGLIDIASYMNFDHAKAGRAGNDDHL